MLRGNELTIKVTKGKANISLSKTQSNAFVFQLLGELLQFFSRKSLLQSKNVRLMY